MATGIPKTQWNGNSQSFNDSTLELKIDVQLAYEGKLPEDEILKTPPASCLQLAQVGESINHLYYGDPNERVSDFSIYGVEPLAEDLQEILDRWRSGKLGATIAQ
jgi:hypothetical protein